MLASYTSLGHVTSLYLVIFILNRQIKISFQICGENHAHTLQSSISLLLLTNILCILVALSCSHLQLELMLGRAEVQQVLAYLTVVRLEGMLYSIWCILQCDFLFLQYLAGVWIIRMFSYDFYCMTNFYKQQWISRYYFYFILVGLSILIICHFSEITAWIWLYTSHHKGNSFLLWDYWYFELLQCLQIPNLFEKKLQEIYGLLPWVKKRS